MFDQTTMTHLTKATITTVLIIATLTAFGQTRFNYHTDFKAILAKTKDKSDSLFYNKLLDRFVANDTTLTDFQVLALLIGFTDDANYKPYNLSPERDIYELNDEGKYTKGLEQGLAFIQDHPLNVKTLFDVSYAYHKLGQPDSAQFYLFKGQRIFEAMYMSGDGKSPETPVFALGPTDGQDFILKFVGGKIGIMGSGRDKNGNFLDILEAELEDGTKIDLYFIIEHATQKMFDGKSIEEISIEQDKKKKGKRK
jgi:hypothetical protein